VVPQHELSGPGERGEALSGNEDSPPAIRSK